MTTQALLELRFEPRW